MLWPLRTLVPFELSVTVTPKVEVEVGMPPASWLGFPFIAPAELMLSTDGRLPLVTANVYVSNPPVTEKEPPAYAIPGSPAGSVQLTDAGAASKVQFTLTVLNPPALSVTLMVTGF